MWISSVDITALVVKQQAFDIYIAYWICTVVDQFNQKYNIYKELHYKNEIIFWNILPIA